MTKWAVALDGSKSSERAFYTMVRTAKEGDEFLLVTVVDVVHYLLVTPTSPTDSISDLKIRMKERGESLLRDYSAKLKELSQNTSTTLLLEGPPREQLVQAVRDHSVNVLVIGLVGLSGAKSSAKLGSTSEYCIRNADCDVYLVK